MGCVYQREYGKGFDFELRCTYVREECSDPDGIDPMNCNYCEQTPQPCPMCSSHDSPPRFLSQSGHGVYWCPHCEQAWRETEDLLVNYSETISDLTEAMTPLLELVNDGKKSDQILNDLAKYAAYLAAIIEASNRVKEEL